MNAFIAQKLEQVLFFERDQQIVKAGGEIPNPFQTMISQVKSGEDNSTDEVRINCNSKLYFNGLFLLIETLVEIEM